jgi:hypothetical protein
MRDDRNSETIVERFDDGERDAINSDRTFFDDVPKEIRWHSYLEIRYANNYFADSINMTLHEMTTEAIFEANGAFEIDWVTRRECSEIGAVEGLVTDIGFPPSGRSIERNNREAATVHGSGIANGSAIENIRTVDAKTRAITSCHGSEFFNNSGEHV